MTLPSFPPSPPSVNFLDEAGLDPGEDGVTPNSTLQVVATGSDWEQISADFPTGFAMYTEALLHSYTGTLASLNSGMMRIGVESFGEPGSSLQVLSVTLPGQQTLRAAIPLPDDASSLQGVGVSVQTKLLTVVVNCSVVTSAWLADMPDDLDIAFVEALDPPTTVRGREGGREGRRERGRGREGGKEGGKKRQIENLFNFFPQVRAFFFSNNESVSETGCDRLTVSCVPFLFCSGVMVSLSLRMSSSQEAHRYIHKTLNLFPIPSPPPTLPPPSPLPPFSFSPHPPLLSTFLHLHPFLCRAYQADKAHLDPLYVPIATDLMFYS